MFKNQIATRLSRYFAIALLVFAAIIGTMFVALFQNYTLNLHKTELSKRATSIAQTMSLYMNGGVQKGGMMGNMGGFGAYLQFVSDIAGTDVWIVDENLNLLTSQMRHGRNYQYSDLPQNAEALVKEVFHDKIVFSEGFSSVLSELTLTVGAPIKNNANNVIGVVLLHSPVNGIDKAVLDGSKLLLVSLCVALVVAFFLSVWLSKNFTDPIVSKQAQDALRLENARREFIANISHELRTPVTVVRGSLEALVDKVVTDPMQVEEYHKQMLNETIFLQRLVGDLLDLSKLQNTEFAIEKQPISVGEVLQDVVRSLSQIAKQKGVLLDTTISNEHCIIEGDYGRIRQMLMIVLDNAIKFSNHGEAVEVTLENRVLTITDYGVGISETEIPYIFDRFYKSRCEQNKTGTGLGLAIAKQIANRHNITIAVSNQQRGGAKFTFHMPSN